MADMVLRIVLLVVIVLVALGLGYFLRRLAVRRMKTTVLDDWIIQTIGIAIFVPFVLITIVVVAFFVTSNIGFLIYFWLHITSGLQGKDVTGIVLGLLGNISESLLIIGLGVGIGRTLMKLVTGRLTEQHMDINIRTLLARVLYGIVIMMIFFWILSLWQISIAVPVTVISALAVAFAFSIQDILKDLVAGLYILWERPFHIGDQVTTSTYTGRVENVQLRATRLRLVSGEEVSIPNALVFGGIVVNNTQYDERRASITLSMPQDEFNKDETPAFILKIVREMENVLVKPEPTVAVTRFTGTFGGTTGSNTGYTAQIVFLTLRFWMPGGHYEIVTEVMCALHKVLPNVDLLVENSGGDI
jgi:small conductance mechanosensitive channel